MELFTNNAPVGAGCQLSCCISRPLFLHFDWVFLSIARGLQTLSYCGVDLIGFLDVARMVRRGGSKEVRAVLDTWYRLLAANCHGLKVC